ncbi:MAG: AraC family transcriptional regulator [Clostridia bacterium]|nr:AraC family transcriptional regulator [Clostridia bacterium]
MEIKLADINPHIRFVRHAIMHAHSKYPLCIPYDARMFALLEGEAEILADSVLYKMKVGDIIFINSGVEYHLLSPDKYAKYLAINFDYTQDAENKMAIIAPAEKEDFVPERMPAHVTFSDSQELSRVLFARGMNKTFSTLDDMKREYDMRLTMHERSLSSHMTDTVIKCLRRQMCNTSPSRAEVLDEIIKYINESFDKDISNKGIAERFHYHPYHLNRLIKQYTGKTLHDYVMGIRISHAIRLLTDTRLSIGEIALACGFYDSAHLIRCFKNVMGTTPRAYRASYI